MQLTNIVLTAATAGLALAAPTEKRQDTWTGPYTLTVNLPGHPIDGKEIEASGLHFYIGPGSPGAYCPTSVTDCPVATDTVFTGGSMYVEVPGGQEGFTQTSGALAFTQAHSVYQPDRLTGFGGPDALGHFKGPNGEGLAACPTTTSQPTAEGVWQVFFEVEGWNRTEGCVCFEATANKWAGNVGAWQYA